MNLTVSYQRGELVEHSTQVQPAAITVDPPPFAFKLPATFTVEGIRGRVIIDGGDGRRHRRSSTTAPASPQSGLITNRLVPRVVQSGQDQNGNPIYKPALDDFDNGRSRIATSRSRGSA